MKKSNILKSLILCAALLLVSVPLSACQKSSFSEISFYEIIAEYDESNKTIDADMTVTYVNNSDAILNEVLFHLYPRAFREGAKFSPVAESERSQAYGAGLSYGDLTVLKVTADGQEQQVKLTGEDEDILSVKCRLIPGDKCVIFISFYLQLPVIRHRMGFYDGIANLGNWYPIACVYGLEGFAATPYYSYGDPFYSDIADYSVTIKASENLTVASSGSQSVTTGGGKKTVVCSIKNARDFAAVIGELSLSSVNHNGVDVRYYYKSDVDPAAQLKAATDSLDTFSDMFGGYIYSTLSIVKTPFLHGGMEYPSLIYISDSLSKERFSEVVIHETAHQWWYAAVGNDQVNHAWLDEGLTEYSTSLFYQKNPDYGVSFEKRIGDALNTYVIYCDVFKSGGMGDTSMNRRVGDYSGSYEYTVMTYIKGELMLDSIREIIGDAAFFSGLKSYYEQNKLKHATPEHLIAALEESSKTNLSTYFSSWIEGKAKLFA